MVYVVRFDDAAALNPDLVGYKFFALAKAARSGYPVPPAVAITTPAHQAFLKEKHWPQGLLSEVLAAADELNLNDGISIRSSATREDLEKQSFAGQYRTFLEVVNRDDLQQKIEQCWASAHSDTVKSYLKASGAGAMPADDTAALMAIVLQKMIHPHAAGVAFGKNPLYPNRDEIIIEAVAGLADNLVSGRISPFRAVIEADGSLTVTAPEASDPWSNKAPPLLRQQQWRQIGEMLRRLERQSRSAPLDIEWAVDQQDRLWLLQSRRITTVDETATDIPAGVWTRKIADDLWADRLTPFLAEVMIRNTPRFDLSTYARITGLNLKQPTLAVINGYLYVNCENLKMVLSLVPRQFHSADLLALLPPGDPRPAESYSKLRRLAVFVRCLVMPLAVPAANPLLCLGITQRRQIRLGRQIERIGRMKADRLENALTKLREATECMARIQENNQWPYMFATVLMWLSRWWTVQKMGWSNDAFFRRLHQGADNVTIRIERRMKAMAAELMMHGPPPSDESYETAMAQVSSGFRRQFEQFLEQYGCRAKQRTLFVKRWAEDPRQLLQLMMALGRQESGQRATGDATALQNRQSDQPRSNRNHKVSSLNTGQRQPPDNVVTRWLLKTTMSYLDRREDLRFLLDQCLFVMRQALLSVGRLTGLDELILFVTMTEMEQIADGRLNTDQAWKRASDRQRYFLRPLPVSAFYVDGHAHDAIADSDSTIAGIGTSPGRSSGVARIVDDPTSQNIQQGDILVARVTDPGWTPILGVIGGLVVEEGGLLNHCSIVARELGIPAVVGVSGATRNIPEGSRVTIDGGLGLVVVETTKS